MSIRTKTRLWLSKNTTTAVQFRTDTTPMVWMHTNLGWIQIGNCPENKSEAETFAKETADSYKLFEADEKTATYFLGYINDP